MNGTVPQSQRAKLPNETVGSPEFCAGNGQSSKSPIRKSKPHRHGKLTQTGASVEITGVYEDKCQSGEFEMNGSHKVDSKISDSKPITSCCHGDVDISSTTLPVFTTHKPLPKVCSGLCDRSAEPIRDSGGRVVSDAVRELHGPVSTTVSKTSDLFNAVEKPIRPDRNGHLRHSEEVKAPVLSPVGEEPTRSKVSTVGQNLEEPFDKPEVTLGKYDLDSQSRDHNALELRFGTIDVVASDVQVPVNLMSSSTPNAAPLQQIMPDLQLPKREHPENGHKASGLSSLSIEEEGGITAGDVEATSEPVHDLSNRRSGLRSQSLPSGLCTPGIQHALLPCYQQSDPQFAEI